MLSAEVSWRREQGINRAYVWLSDGTVAGYRDLDSGLDHLDVPTYADLVRASVDGWITTYGVPCGQLAAASVPEPSPVPSGRGLVGWWRRSRARRHGAGRQVGTPQRPRNPLWRVPTDPPNGGWRDLVRNEPGEALWQKTASLTPPSSVFDRTRRRQARSWQVGAQGEETVAKELERLGGSTSWRYLHSVPVGRRGSDIDHVLVGRGGVITVNTKAHRGSNVWVGGSTFIVNGHRYPYIRNARYESARASKLLSRACGFDVPVLALIVVVDPRRFTVKTDPGDVAVTTRRFLGSFLSRRPDQLTESEVEAIFERARRSTTWQ